MTKKNRIAMILTAGCIGLLLLASCATRGTGTRQDTGTSPLASQESQIAGKPAEDVDAPIKEEEITELEKTGATPQPTLKDREIDAKILSEIRAIESKPIYFDFDKSTLTPDALATLRNLAAWLHANPRYSVQIEGHTDERGSNGYNLALGETRAIAAEKYLQTLGIEAGRISTLSWGEESPADSAKNDEAWAKNRRDEFKLIRNP